MNCSGIHRSNFTFMGVLWIYMRFDNFQSLILNFVAIIVRSRQLDLYFREMSLIFVHFNHLIVTVTLLKQILRIKF